MIITSLNVLAVKWFAAILAALLVASVIIITNPFGSKIYSPQEAKAKVETMRQEAAETQYLSLANMYDELAAWYEARAVDAAPTGYPAIDDVMPKQDEYYRQAEEYRRQAKNYRAMAYTDQSPVSPSEPSQDTVY